MVILGIDPGTVVAGFAIMRCDGGKSVALLACDVLRQSSRMSLVDRVGTFFAFFNEIIVRYGVTVLSLETPFLGKNAQNFLKLGYLRGACYTLAYQHKILVVECSPREVKQAVTGYGAADKDQVARVLSRLFPGLLVSSLQNDATDAIAVALCGLWRVKNNTLSLVRKTNYKRPIM